LCNKTWSTTKKIKIEERKPTKNPGSVGVPEIVRCINFV